MAGEQDVTCLRGSGSQSVSAWRRNVFLARQQALPSHPFGSGGEGTFIGRAELILVRLVHPLGLGMVCTHPIAQPGLLHRELQGLKCCWGVTKGLGWVVVPEGKQG